MQRDCDVCGIAYTAQRSTSRYCSTRCRTRATRSGKSSPAKVVTLAPAPAASGAVEAATVARLSEADRLDSPMGQIAVTLARRMDSPGMDTGSAIAAVARQLSATLTEALRGTAKASGPQVLADELAARRAAHGA